MFDTYRLAPVSPSHVNVTENRAPTDESVRLLRDMEKKARDEVIKAIRLDGALVDGVLHEQADHLSGQLLFKCIFRVNGKRMEADFRCFQEESSAEKIALGIRDAIASQIANVITDGVLRSAGKFSLTR